MLQRVVWYGRQISWPTDAAHAEFPHVCRYVQNALKKVIMLDMISTCFLAKQEALATVEIHLS